MTVPETLLKVVNLQKRIGNTWILRNVSFSVASKSVHLLLGPNGAGKTTTLKCILGLYRRYRGSIELTIPRSLVGYVPEIPYALPGYKVKELLELALARNKLTLKDVSEMLEALEVSEFLDKDISKLSKGQRKRVYLAIALASEPRLLILDEPLAGVDIDHVIRFRELFMKLKSSGVTLLVSSHILFELEDIVDRVTIIYSGESLKTISITKLFSIDNGISYELFLMVTADLDNFIKELRGRFGIEHYELLSSKLVKLRVSLSKSELKQLYEVFAAYNAVILRARLLGSGLYELYVRELKLYKNRIRER
jgi:ABC-2 type transport system ATP-binding protein